MIRLFMTTCPGGPLPLGLAALLLLSGCGRHKDSQAVNSAILPTLPVRVAKVESGTLSSHVEVMGTVRARLRATLEARVSGRIGEMPVRLGDHVQAGQLIARLDAPEIQARLQQAQANLQQAERDWNRAKTLFQQQATTRSESETAESRYHVAQGALAEAKAMLTYIEVNAPFAGVVTRKLADVGDLAAPGKPLAQIEDPSALQLETDIPEVLARNLRADVQFFVRLDGLQNQLPAVVAEIAPSVNPVSRTLQVKLDLPKDAAVRPGQFGRLLVPVAENESLRVPATAVVRRGQLELAFVVDDKTAHLNLVKTGRQSGKDVEILSGLQPGQTVVVEGAQQLVDNQPVAVQ